MTHAMRELLLPQTTILTPNSLEARRLAESRRRRGAAARRLRRAAARDWAASTCSSPARTRPRRRSSTRCTAQGGVVRTDTWQRLPGSYHGSGCTLASAIAAMLANGLDMPEAVREAQDYTWHTLQEGLPPRHGPVPARPPVLGARGGRRARRGRGRAARPPMSAAATDARAAARRARARRLRGLYAVTPDSADTARPRRAGRGGDRRRRDARSSTATRPPTPRSRASRPRALAARLPRRAARCSSSTTTPRSPRAVGADGVHLGEDDGSVARGARAASARTRIVGVSCYDDLARARSRRRGGRRLRRVRQLLPVGRQAATRGARASRCSSARRDLGVPVVAIGGITADNAGALVARRRRRGRRHHRRVRRARRCRRAARRAPRRRRQPPRRMSAPGRRDGDTGARSATALAERTGPPGADTECAD